ncbi:hypothetical protein DFH06DRAFT_356992 [Mycena polygramma]|nr:hypothetical protein DFH06DRAFT_356992 [Mycena polygramma]
MGKKKTSFQEKELHALSIPFPDDLDRYFRHPSDPADDYTKPYMRAVDFGARLGDTLAAHLWQQALEIGVQAGRGNIDAIASDAQEEGRRRGQEEGLSLGQEVGQKAGLSEGKRLGFVAGREFGEKQAAKLSNSPIPGRVLVDTGTDSPVAAPSLPPPTPAPTVASPSTGIARTTVPSTAPSLALSWANLRIYAPDLSPPIHASTQTDALPDPAPPSIAPSPPFTWSDEVYAAPAHIPSPLPPPAPRDFSVLRSASTPLTPFITLQRRSHRKQKSARPPCQSASRSAPSRFPHARSAPAYRPRSASATTLDWDHDPRLSDLSRALRLLGWDRGRGGGV